MANGPIPRLLGPQNKCLAAMSNAIKFFGCLSVCLKGVSRVSQGCLKGGSMVFQRCSKGVPRVLKGVLNMFLVFFKGVSRAFQGCCKDVPMKFQR